MIHNIRNKPTMYKKLVGGPPIATTTAHRRAVNRPQGRTFSAKVEAKQPSNHRCPHSLSFFASFFLFFCVILYFLAPHDILQRISSIYHILLREFSSCRYRTRAIKQLFGSRLTAVSGFWSASKTCSWGCKFILDRHYFAKFLLGFVPRRILATDNCL